MRLTRLTLGLLLVAFGAFAACSDDTSLGTGNTVNANGQTFDPDSLNVSGTDKTVTWGIFGGGPHTITFQDAVTSGNRNSGAYSRNFSTDTVGTYRYRCENHSLDFLDGMVGVVVVQ